jgi:myo-inositol-1(or 4)-monophosphatase
MEKRSSELAIYERARDEAVAAVHLGARLMEERVGRLERDEIREKGEHDIVTVLDEEVQNLLIGRLSATFPDHAFLAEEGDLSQADHAVDGFRWIIDPIDGTTNFSRGAPPYAISVGLQHDDDIVVGVILEPTRNELYTAVRGQGLFLNGRPIAVSKTKSLSSAVVATGFPYRAIETLDAFLEVLASFIRTCHGFRRLGSAAADLAYVASGRFDAFYETGLSAWDMAAGRLLVEEGGGRVTALDGGPHGLFSGEILVSNGLVHDEMLSFLGPLVARRRELAARSEREGR